MVAACTMLTAVVLVAFPFTVISQAFGAAADEYVTEKKRARLQRQRELQVCDNVRGCACVLLFVTCALAAFPLTVISQAFGAAADEYATE